MALKRDFQGLLEEFGRTATNLWKKGWAERNAGNMSVRLIDDQILSSFVSTGEWIETGAELPEIAGDFLLITGTGCHMRNIELDPERNLGVVEISGDGKKYRKVWGFRGDGSPTCELPVHFRCHAVRKRVKDGLDHVIIHTHPTNLIAITFRYELDTAKLTRLLWESHTECIVVFPMGCGFIDWILPGSDELGEATADVLSTRDMTAWQFHGIVAAGPDLDTTFGLIDTAEKASEIFVKADSMGGRKFRISPSQLKSLADAYCKNVDKDILDYS